MTATAVPARPSWPERVVARLSRPGRTDRSRRRLLFRGTLVATALALDPLRYVLRPGSAWASVCGSGNTCGGGWTAFCCTINDGANTCPPGTYAAGWWKVDNSAYCNGGPRYIIDCNRHPSATCNCECSSDACDGRKVCCNVFRYGQCNRQVPGVTEVVCRVIICTTPWEWDPTCSSTARTDNRTASHTSRCLPGPNPTPIEVRHQDLGMAGSPVGRQTRDERDTSDRGRRADYERGLLYWSSATGVMMLTDPFADAWDRYDAEAGELGRPVADVERIRDDRGARARFVGGTIWSSPTTGTRTVTGALRDFYVRQDGARGWLGYPTTDVGTVEGPWRRFLTEAGWQVVEQTERDQIRVLPDDVDLPPDGSWPPRVELERWSGDTRVETAVEVARRTFPDGSASAVLVTSADFPDALVGGVAAGTQGEPLLLVSPDRLDAVVARALDDLGVESVTVIGGPGTVADAVVDDLARRGLRVQRFAGRDRYATAVVVSRAVFRGTREVVFVATGRDFPDALAATPTIVSAGGPLLLVDPDAIPEVVQEELRRLQPRAIVVLGGPNVIGANVESALRLYADRVRRIGGADRYQTAVASIPDDADTSTLFVATGESFPDGLAAGAAAATRGAVLLLARTDDVPDVTWEFARRAGATRIVLVGGDAVLSRVVERQFEALVLPPGPEPEPEPDSTASDDAVLPLDP